MKKESKNIEKCLAFIWELKNCKNMKVSVVPIVAGALGMTPKGLERIMEELEIWGRIETIDHNIVKILEYWFESYGHEETCCRLDSSKSHQLTLYWRSYNE